MFCESRNCSTFTLPHCLRTSFRLSTLKAPCRHEQSHFLKQIKSQHLGGGHQVIKRKHVHRLLLAIHQSPLPQAARPPDTVGRCVDWRDRAEERELLRLTVLQPEQLSMITILIVSVSLSSTLIICTVYCHYHSRSTLGIFEYWKLHWNRLVVRS